MKGTKTPLIAIFSLFFITLVLAQGPDCSGTGKYCLGDAIYDCVDGEGKSVEFCSGYCSEGACVSDPLQPEYAKDRSDEVVVSEPGGRDLVFILVVIILTITFFLLFFNLRSRKKKYEKA